MSFWEAFLLLAVFIPLTILWVVCVLDLVFKRHDLSGLGRAAWITAIIFFPALGSLAYVAFGGMAPLGGSGAGSPSGPAASAREDALRLTGRTPY
jgi:Phospholipase_D-nuclease N-terminal